MYHKTLLMLLLTLSILAAPTASAADISMIEAGRAIVARHKDAVITVQVVVKLKIQNQERETKNDVIGTVVREDGLTVLALSSIDPSALFGNMGGMQFDSEIVSIDFLLPDGTEIEAKEIIRDPELDLAFVRPVKKPEKPMAYIDLSKDGDVEILDYVVTLNRLGKVANRVNAATFEQIEGVVRKPRTFYVPSSSVTNTNQGSIAFNLKGEVIGLFVLRSIRSDGGARGDNVAGIILPAADVLDGALQAPGFDE